MSRSLVERRPPSTAEPWRYAPSNVAAEHLDHQSHDALHLPGLRPAPVGGHSRHPSGLETQTSARPRKAERSGIVHLASGNFTLVR